MPKDRSNLPIVHLSVSEIKDLTTQLKDIICGQFVDDEIVAEAVNQLLFPEDRAYHVEQLRSVIQSDHDESLIYSAINQSLPLTFKELWLAGGGAVQFSPYVCLMFHSLFDVSKAMQKHSAFTEITDQGLSIIDMMRKEYDHYYRVVELARELGNLSLNTSFKDVVESTRVVNRSETYALCDVREMIASSRGNDRMFVSLEVKQLENRIEFLGLGSKSAPSSPVHKKNQFSSLLRNFSSNLDQMEDSDDNMKSLMLSAGHLQMPKNFSHSSLSSLDLCTSDSAGSSTVSSANNSPARASIKRNPNFSQETGSYSKLVKAEMSFGRPPLLSFSSSAPTTPDHEPPILAKDVVANLAFLEDSDTDNAPPVLGWPSLNGI